MDKLKSLLGNLFAVAYFVFFMLFEIFVLIFLLVFPHEVNTIRTSGFAGKPPVALIGIGGMIIGLSILISPLRKMYYVLPWLHAFVKVFFTNLIILSIGISILNYGYQVNNEARHTLFFSLMIIQLVVSRIAMCIYFKLKPVGCFDEG